MSSGAGERILQENFVVTLGYPDGSIATISYASDGDPKTDKERIDIFGRSTSGSNRGFLERDDRRASRRVSEKGQRSRGNSKGLPRVRQGPVACASTNDGIHEDCSGGRRTSLENGRE